MSRKNYAVENFCSVLQIGVYLLIVGIMATTFAGHADPMWYDKLALKMESVRWLSDLPLF